MKGLGAQFDSELKPEFASSAVQLKQVLTTFNYRPTFSDSRLMYVAFVNFTYDASAV